MNRKQDSAPAYDATVVAPRFDEQEAATARPVVPLGSPRQADASAGKRAAGRPSLRAVSHHLLLAWAVFATVAAGAVAIYRNGHSTQTQAVQQPTPESTPGVATATPQPVRREVTVAPARPAKLTEVRQSPPAWEGNAWSSDREVAESDELDEEELEERARKEEKRRRKEEKKRREEAEKETERALKEARKRAERLREKMKEEGGKSRLIGVLSGRSGA